ncbi:GH92 family glycosyl hydrolase [Pseudoxanthomonas sp. Root630]|uniref:GH92 family glycosyl hydrolase n=1 Tax=Pseudoxanthomonas sp. Root630 TaxID=1736574 RepID=UPI000703B03A|nr:GH92 family glycosyl hydrolase [Pseudoxanthomonas sp. Root630]KRA42502.1 alpha-1 2-mannosidase [Pseudoxanthomonas sp. Root630]
MPESTLVRGRILPIALAMLLLPHVASARDARFATSFEAGEPVPAGATAGTARIAVGDGPAQPYAAKAGKGYTGDHALNYRADAAGRVSLFAVDIGVEKDTTLSWMVLPEIVAGDAAASTGVSLDLVFDDGRRLSALGVVDQHGAPVTAAGQAASMTLYPQQWARKQVRVGEVPALRGKRIRAIELQLEPGAHGASAGWIDDIAIDISAPADKRRPSDYVLTTRGTQSNSTFSRGNNIPAAAMPHGFNFWVPVTDAGSLSWLYRWNEQNGPDNRPRLQALSISHQPSPWMGDRQTFQVMPSAASGIPEADRGKRALSFTHDREEARPHTYRVDFDNGIRAEIAPSERAAIFRFRFPEDGDANLLFDNVDARGGLTLDDATQSLHGYTDTRSGLSNGATRMFVYARFDQPWRESGQIATGRPTGYVKFSPGRDGEVSMRIATSLISVEQARRNLDLEIGTAGFEDIRSRAQTAWDELLGRVRVDGASEDQRVTVYSNLYRLFLYPNIAHENVGSPEQPDWRHADQNSWSKDNTGGDALRTSAPVRAGRVYVNNGFWDTFRTTWPAYSLFAPERAGEMIDGFLQQYRDGGWIARWSSPGYADLMVGTSSDVAFADAWLKGVRGFDAHEAYEAALRNATVVPPVSNVGRKGLARSMYRGYADSSVHEGLSWTLEGALNDFGLAQLGLALAAEEKDAARAQRYREEAAYLQARATDYTHLFDPATSFFRGRTAGGGWHTPAARFDPRVWGGDYTEANAWTFAFTVPHDGAGLASLYGGEDALAKRLDAFFATPETAEKRFSGAYGDVIHEMTEARDVRMGMYAHSNQPSHHIPWMYVAAGQPWKTQRVTRDIMRRLYLGSEIGQGYPGDEDNGEMSAWYLFGMLGLYPLRMGAPEYVIGSPAFPRAEVDLGGGRTLTVTAHNNNARNVYVQSLKVNGAPWTRAWLRHADIAGGGTLEFVMGDTPSTWGSGADALPPSLTPPGEAPSGLADITSKAVSVSLGARRQPRALVDDDASTSLALPAGEGIGFRFAAAERASYYTLTSADTPLSALSWVLEGRSGEGAWTLLDQRRAQAFAWARQLRPFGIAHPGDYTEYRVRFEAGSSAALAEIELLQPVPRQATP